MSEHEKAEHCAENDFEQEHGQDYVRRGILTATVITKPLTGLALELLVPALASSTQPPEHTLG